MAEDFADVELYLPGEGQDLLSQGWISALHDVGLHRLRPRKGSIPWGWEGLLPHPHFMTADSSDFGPERVPFKGSYLSIKGKMQAPPALQEQPASP